MYETINDMYNESTLMHTLSVTKCATFSLLQSHVHTNSHQEPWRLQTFLSRQLGLLHWREYCTFPPPLPVCVRSPRDPSWLQETIIESVVQWSEKTITCGIVDLSKAPVEPRSRWCHHNSKLQYRTLVILTNSHLWHKTHATKPLCCTRHISQVKDH